MRKMKFRGKRIADGKWVYGYLAEIETDWDFYNGHGLPTEYSKVIIETNLLTRPMAIIAPETIGQYTGIKDRNETEIYEGDILKYLDLRNREVIITVWWEDDIAGFNFGNRNLAFIKHRLEVIGNIHDNPELLEVE